MGIVGTSLSFGASTTRWADAAATDSHRFTGDHLKTTITLRRKARRLRTEASELPSPLAAAYRRRASELELQAYLLSAQQLSHAA
jgi:hypothetical protein